MNDDHAIICLYVDDMLIFGICNDIVFKTKSFLASKFNVKDMVKQVLFWELKL